MKNGKSKRMSLVLGILWGISAVLWGRMLIRDYRDYVAGWISGSDLVLPALNLVVFSILTLIWLWSWRRSGKEEQTDLE